MYYEKRKLRANGFSSICANDNCRKYIFSLGRRGNMTFHDHSPSCKMLFDNELRDELVSFININDLTLPATQNQNNQPTPLLPKQLKKISPFQIMPSIPSVSRIQSEPTIPLIPVSTVPMEGLTLKSEDLARTSNVSSKGIQVTPTRTSQATQVQMVGTSIGIQVTTGTQFNSADVQTESIPVTPALLPQLVPQPPSTSSSPLPEAVLSPSADANRRFSVFKEAIKRLKPSARGYYPNLRANPKLLEIENFGNFAPSQLLY